MPRSIIQLHKHTKVRKNLLSISCYRKSMEVGQKHSSNPSSQTEETLTRDRCLTRTATLNSMSQQQQTLREVWYLSPCTGLMSGTLGTVNSQCVVLGMDNSYTVLEAMFHSRLWLSNGDSPCLCSGWHHSGCRDWISWFCFPSLEVRSYCYALIINMGVSAILLSSVHFHLYKLYGHVALLMHERILLIFRGKWASHGEKPRNNPVILLVPFLW